MSAIQRLARAARPILGALNSSRFPCAVEEWGSLVAAAPKASLSTESDGNADMGSDLEKDQDDLTGDDEPSDVQGFDVEDEKEERDSDGDEEGSGEDNEDAIPPRGEVYDVFDDLGELDELENLDGLDELDEIAMRVSQKEFEPDSLMGVPGDIDIDEEVLGKLEKIKEGKANVWDTPEKKADDEHLRFKTQQRQLEGITLAMGTYVPPHSGKPLKAQRVDDLLEDVDEKRKELGDQHPSVLKLLTRLANALDEHRKYEKSESIYQEVLGIRKKVWGDAHELTAIATIAVGNNLRNQGKTSEAEKFVDKGMELLIKASPLVTKSLISVGDQLIEDGESEKAEGMHRAAVILAKFAHGEVHVEVATALRHLVQCILNSDHFEDAEQYAKEELELRKKLDGDESAEVAVSIATLGYCCMAMENYREADLEIREGLAMRRKLVGKVDQEVGRMTQYLGFTLMALHLFKEAEDMYRDAISIYERLGHSGKPILAAAMMSLADALLAQNKLREYHSVHRHAVSLHQKLGISVMGED